MTDPKVDALIPKVNMQEAVAAMRQDHIRRLGDVLCALGASMPFMPDPKIDDFLDALLNVYVGTACRAEMPLDDLVYKLKLRFIRVTEAIRDAGKKAARAGLGIVDPSGQPVLPAEDAELAAPAESAPESEPQSSPAEPAPALELPSESPVQEPASAEPSRSVIL